MSEKIAKVEVAEEQLLYANILNKGMVFGLLGLFITFGIYVFGILDPYIPLEKLSGFWKLDVTSYLTNPDYPIHAGWAWVSQLHYGDFLNFVPIAILAGVTIICYAAIIPTLLRSNDKIFAIIAALEVLVLVVAASGILGSGGH